MKKFKKVIPALCMLMVSAIMLGSSTYAWFSMNDKVTATGMEVTANTETKFLVISESTTLADKTTVTFSDTGKKVYPSARATGQMTAADQTTIKENEWYTANSTVYDDAGASNMTNIKKIDEGNENYHIVHTFYIGVAGNSDTYTGKLVIKNTSTLGAGVKAIVRIGGTDYVFDNSTSQKEITSITLGKTGTEVKVILYVDGTDSTVKSSNADTISGKLDLTFTASTFVNSGT